MQSMRFLVSISENIAVTNGTEWDPQAERMAGASTTRHFEFDICYWFLSYRHCQNWWIMQLPSPWRSDRWRGKNWQWRGTRLNIRGIQIFFKYLSSSDILSFNLKLFNRFISSEAMDKQMYDLWIIPVEHRRMKRSLQEYSVPEGIDRTARGEGTCWFAWASCTVLCLEDFGCEAR